MIMGSVATVRRNHPGTTASFSSGTDRHLGCPDPDVAGDVLAALAPGRGSSDLVVVRLQVVHVLAYRGGYSPPRSRLASHAYFHDNDRRP